MKASKQQDDEAASGALDWQLTGDELMDAVEESLRHPERQRERLLAQTSPQHYVMPMVEELRTRWPEPPNGTLVHVVYQYRYKAPELWQRHDLSTDPSIGVDITVRWIGLDGRFARWPDVTYRAERVSTATLTTWEPHPWRGETR